MALSVSAQQSGSIAGKMTDGEVKGQPLPFATASIKGTEKGTTTDFDGLYQISNVEPGTYTVEFSFLGYKTRTIPDVKFEANKVTEINITLSASAAALDEVVINTVRRKDSEIALLLEQKRASKIKESIGARELAELGVSDAATATSKISGVSISEASGNIFVRGLGDRYLYTTMNGLPVPSDDVQNKNIDLALFPTRVTQNLSISKTFSADSYADQSSGAINIDTRELDGNEEYSLGTRVGVNTNAVQGGVGNNFKRSANEGDINIGFYSKDIPTRRAITEQTWNTQSISLPLNYRHTATAGKRFDNDFEFLVNIAQSGKYEYREGVFQEFRENNLDDSYTDVREYQKTISTSGLLDLGYRFNDSNKLKVTSLFINKLEDNVYEAGRNGKGFTFEETRPADSLNQFIRDQNTKQTNMWINQLIGEHTFSEKDEFSWALGYNLVNADQPNRIRNQINFNEDEIELARTGGFQQRKSYQEIDDQEFAGRANNSYQVFDKDSSSSLNIDLGGNFRIKDRDFKSQFFGVTETSLRAVTPAGLDNLSSVFTPQNFDNDNLSLNVLTPDVYNASLNSYGGYISFNYDYRGFNFNMGGRYEKDELDVNYDVSNSQPGESKKSYGNFYPALNVKYSLNEKTNFRLAASKTITLPEFKEIAPFEYVSQNGQVTRGNPDLEASNVYNLDLKWEFFPQSDELISLTGFYKYVEDPINRAQSRGSAGVFSYYNSGEKAQVYGLEFDLDYNLLENKSENGINLDLGFNATRMWHNQDLKEIRDADGNLLRTFRYKDNTETGLQGASDWIVNGNITLFTNWENEFRANLNAYYASDKIFAIGAPTNQRENETFYNDAIVEKGFVVLNTTITQELSEHWRLRLQGKNLLNPLIKRKQDVNPLNGPEREETVRSYSRGSVINIGARYIF